MQDVEALMSEIDFSDLQTAERRALLQQATACKKQSPALYVALQRLAEQEVIRESYRDPPGSAGHCASGTLDFWMDGDEGPPGVYTLRDVDPRRSKLFTSNVEDADMWATLEVENDHIGVCRVRPPSAERQPAQPVACLQDILSLCFSGEPPSCTSSALG